MSGRWRAIGATVAVALACGGCAMLHPRPLERPGLDVVVENDFQPPRAFVVYLVHPNGSRSRLGSAGSEPRTTWHVSSDVPPGDYLLVAQDALGRELVAQRVSISTGENRLTWRPAERFATSDRTGL